MAYSDDLLNPKWQKKRIEILYRDKFTCRLCGDIHTTLAIHHTEYAGKPWEINNDKLKTVCVHCHDLIHALPKENIIKIIKQISPVTKCWCCVVFAEDKLIFTYLFFETNEFIKPAEIICVYSDLNMKEVLVG